MLQSVNAYNVHAAVLCHVLASLCRNCATCASPQLITMFSCLQMGDHGVAGQHKYQLEEAQRAEKRVSPAYHGTLLGLDDHSMPHWLHDES